MPSLEAALEIPQTITCPACGGANDKEAVFCGNPACHKALGEFKYVAEEVDHAIRWHESLAEKVTEFIGRPHFLVAHVILFTLWVLINTGIVAFMWLHSFDSPPFGLLGIILTAEAILMTGFILISQNRQNAHATKLAEIDYEISVRTYRQINHVADMLHTLQERIAKLEERTQDEPDAHPDL